MQRAIGSRLIYGILLLVLLSACRSKKAVLPPIDQNIPLDSLLYALEAHNVDYTWFSAKAKVKFDAPQESGSATCRIRIRRDSVIWMNVRKLGVEASRILIRPDSFFILYRLDKLYEAGTLVDLAETYALSADFRELQDMIVGNVRLPIRDHSRSTIDSLYFRIDTRFDDYDAKFWLDGALNLRRASFADHSNRQLHAQFDDYQVISDSLHFSYLRNYFVALENGENGHARFDFSKVEIDVPKAIKFKIPPGYSPI